MTELQRTFLPHKPLDQLTDDDVKKGMPIKILVRWEITELQRTFLPHKPLDYLTEDVVVKNRHAGGPILTYKVLREVFMPDSQHSYQDCCTC